MKKMYYERVKGVGLYTVNTKPGDIELTMNATRYTKLGVNP